MNGYSVALFLITLITLATAAIVIPRNRRALRQFKAECDERRAGDKAFRASCLQLETIRAEIHREAREARLR